MQRELRSKIFNPDGVTQSINHKKQGSKEYLLMMASAANPLIDSSLMKTKPAKAALDRLSKNLSPKFTQVESTSMMAMAKQRFNRNTETTHETKLSPVSANHFTGRQLFANPQRKQSLNFVNGSVYDYPDSRPSHNRKALLPLAQRYDYDGLPKAEYTSQFSNQPRMFMRQNGDFTHLANLQVQNKHISTKNLSPSLSKTIM